MKEYAFDIKLNAVVRIKAVSEQAARDAVDAILEAVEISQEFTEGYNDAAHTAKITEASLGTDSSAMSLFEVDGENVAAFSEALNGLQATMFGDCHHGDTGGGICLDCGHDTCDDEEEE